MPATYSTTTMTPSMSAMLAALSTERGASVTELSTRAELGRSTAARVLTTLEGMGLARRERPDRSADHNSPDLWFTAAADQFEPYAAGDESAERTREAELDHRPEISAEAEVDDSQPTPSSEPENADESAHAHDGEGTDEPTPQIHEEAGPGTASEGEAHAVQPDPEPAADPAPTADGTATDPGHDAQAASATSDTADPDAHATPESASAADATDPGDPVAAAPTETGAALRLGKGELRVMVFEHLKAHPDEDFTASQVGKALNKSSGAVSNNFDALVRTGDAQMTCEKPRRFRFLAKAAS